MYLLIDQHGAITSYFQHVLSLRRGSANQQDISRHQINQIVQSINSSARHEPRNTLLTSNLILISPPHHHHHRPLTFILKLAVSQLHVRVPALLKTFISFPEILPASSLPLLFSIQTCTWLQTSTLSPNPLEANTLNRYKHLHTRLLSAPPQHAHHRQWARLQDLHHSRAQTECICRIECRQATSKMAR